AWIAGSTIPSDCAAKSPLGNGSEMLPAPASNGCSQQTRPGPKWAAPIPPLPKSRNHCAEPLARLRHHQGASTRPLPVDTGERPLCAPVHTLAKRRPALSPSCRTLHDDHSNGGVRCRHLSSSTCQEILEISANAQSKSIEQIVRYFAQRYPS